jgi:hypothetical protein
MMLLNSLSIQATSPAGTGLAGCLAQAPLSIG